MPEPVVFQSSNSRGLHLYWFTAEEIPTEPAVTLLSRVLAEQGVQVGRGTCEVRPTTGQCLRLPLGAESALLMPDSLLQYSDIGANPGAAIDFLVRTTKRYRAQQLLDRLTNGSRQLSFPTPNSTPATTTAPMRPVAPAQPLPPQPGLTKREIAVLWHVTTPLQGLTRVPADAVFVRRGAGVQDGQVRHHRAAQAQIGQGWPERTRARTRTASTLRRQPVYSSAPTTDEPGVTKAVQAGHAV